MKPSIKKFVTIIVIFTIILLIGISVYIFFIYDSIKDKSEIKTDITQNDVLVSEEPEENLQNADPNIAQSNYKYVTASSLRMREEPNLEGKVILEIPEGKVVKVLEQKSEMENISGEDGKWVRVEYKRKNAEGWVFDAYLAEFIIDYSVNELNDSSTLSESGFGEWERNEIKIVSNIDPEQEGAIFIGVNEDEYQLYTNENIEWINKYQGFPDFQTIYKFDNIWGNPHTSYAVDEKNNYLYLSVWVQEGELSFIYQIDLLNQKKRVLYKVKYPEAIVLRGDGQDVDKYFISPDYGSHYSSPINIIDLVDDRYLILSMYECWGCTVCAKPIYVVVDMMRANTISYKNIGGLSIDAKENEISGRILVRKKNEEDLECGGTWEPWGDKIITKLDGYEDNEKFDIHIE